MIKYKLFTRKRLTLDFLSRLCYNSVIGGRILTGRCCMVNRLRKFLYIIAFIDFFLIFSLLIAFFFFFTTPVEIMRNIEVGVVVEKRASSFSTSIDMGEKRLSTISNQSFYDAVEIGDRVVFFDKYCKYPLRDGFTISNYRLYDEFVREFGQPKGGE